MDAPKTVTNREIAEKLTAQTCANDHIGGELRHVLCGRIERALDAKDAALLEADKNGYERGRKEMREIVNDEIGDESERDGARGHGQSMHLGAMDALSTVLERMDEHIRLAPSGGVSKGNPNV